MNPRNKSHHPPQKKLQEEATPFIHIKNCLASQMDNMLTLVIQLALDSRARQNNLWNLGDWLLALKKSSCRVFAIAKMN